MADDQSETVEQNDGRARQILYYFIFLVKLYEEPLSTHVLSRLHGVSQPIVSEEQLPKGLTPLECSSRR